MNDMSNANWNMSEYPILTRAEQTKFLAQIKLDVELLNKNDEYDVRYLVDTLHAILYKDGISDELFRLVKPYYLYLTDEVLPTHAVIG